MTKPKGLFSVETLSGGAVVRRLLYVIGVWYWTFSALADGSARDLRLLLQEPAAQESLGSFLAVLKADEKFSPLFHNFTLAKSSLSLQSSSALKPRVLMFGDTAELILTFNSIDASAGYSLEIADYDRAQRRIGFFEILFKNEFPQKLVRALEQIDSLKEVNPTLLRSELMLTPSDIEFETQAIAVTKVNPNKCLQCHEVSPRHTQHARYIWDDYPLWPRFYGERHDILSAEERTSFAQFKDLAAAHDRYSYLDLRTIGQEPASQSYRKRTNLRLTKLIGAYQAEAYAELIEPELNRAGLLALSEKLVCDGRSMAAELIPVNQAIASLPVNLSPTHAEGSFNLGSHMLLGSHTDAGQHARGLESHIAQALARNFLLTQPETQSAIRSLMKRNHDYGKQGFNNPYHQLYQASAEFWKSLSASYMAYGLSREQANPGICETVRGLVEVN